MSQLLLDVIGLGMRTMHELFFRQIAEIACDDHDGRFEVVFNSFLGVHSLLGCICARFNGEKMVSTDFPILADLTMQIRGSVGSRDFVECQRQKMNENQ